ncbi:MAG TPA: DNA-binding protein [Gammaproteobacteria bacterium]|nr:DNA-binding protein [Gammaproteobacteria bacterium]
MKTRKVKHPAMLEVAHEMAKGLYEANVINATTMREFDTLCLVKTSGHVPDRLSKKHPD